MQDACRVHSLQHQPREQQQEQQQHRSLYIFNVEGRRWNAPLLLGLFDRFEALYADVVGAIAFSMLSPPLDLCRFMGCP